MSAAFVGAAVALTALLAVAARDAAARERILAVLDVPVVSGGAARTRRSASAPRILGMGGVERRDQSERWRLLLGAGLCGALLGFRLVGPVGAVAGLGGGIVAVRAFVGARVTRERVRAERQLSEFVDAVAAAVRAGLSVRRALHEASRDIDPPLRHALDAVRNALDVGEPLERALERLTPAVGRGDARLLSSMFAVHARSGGDLPRLLDDVAEIVRQRIEGARSVRALTAQGRASGAVLAVLPVAFVALLSWTSGDGLGAFYRTPLGAALLSAGLACQALGFAWIRRIVGAPALDR